MPTIGQTVLPMIFQPPASNPRLSSIATDESPFHATNRTLWHQIETTIAKPQSVEDHRDRRRAHTHPRVIARIESVQVRCETNFLAHASHDT